VSFLDKNRTLDKNRSLNNKPALIILLALLAAAILIGHQTLPTMDRDESRFAQASKQMLHSGDFVTVRFQDDLRAKKPVGIYWLQTISAALFGDTKIAAFRVPSLLAMLLTVYGTYRIARSLYKPPRALLSAAACGASLIVFAEAHLAKTDSVLMLLCFCQQFALFRIYQAWQHGRRLPYWSYLWFWVPMAAAVLVKGPVAPVLAMTTVGGLSLWHRNIRWMRLLRPWQGIFALAVITLPWAIMVTLATDGAFLDLAFRGDFVAKVQSGQESHGAPIGTYLLLAGVLLWPASLLLPRAASQLRLLTAHVESRFMLAWAVPFWALIELVPTKLPHYPLPVIPALAILLVCAVEAPLAGSSRPAKNKSSWNENRDQDSPNPFFALLSLDWLRGFRVQNFRRSERSSQKFTVRGSVLRWIALAAEFAMMTVGPVLGGVMIWAALTFGGVTSGRAFAFALLACVMVGLAMWQGILWHLRGGIRPVALMLAAGVIFHFIVIAGLLPSLSRVHVARAIDESLIAADTRPAAIAAAGFHEPSLVFHLGRDLLLVNGGEAALFLAEAPGGMAIVEKDQQPAFLEMADQLGLRLSVPVQIEGFNMSKGRNIRIFLYRTTL